MNVQNLIHIDTVSQDGFKFGHKLCGITSLFLLFEWTSELVYNLLKVLSSVLVYAIAFGLLKSSESDDLGYADVKVFSNLAITGKPHYL